MAHIDLQDSTGETRSFLPLVSRGVFHRLGFVGFSGWESESEPMTASGQERAQFQDLESTCVFFYCQPLLRYLFSLCIMRECVCISAQGHSPDFI